MADSLGSLASDLKYVDNEWKREEKLSNEEKECCLPQNLSLLSHTRGIIIGPLHVIYHTYVVSFLALLSVIFRVTHKSVGWHYISSLYGNTHKHREPSIRSSFYVFLKYDLPKGCHTHCVIIVCSVTHTITKFDYKSLVTVMWCGGGFISFHRSLH